MTPVPGRSAGRPACGREGKSAARAAAAASRLCCSAAADTAAMVTCRQLLPSSHYFALTSPHCPAFPNSFAKMSSCSDMIARQMSCKHQSSPHAGPQESLWHLPCQ